jgi:hypothetical protein
MKWEGVELLLDSRLDGEALVGEPRTALQTASGVDFVAIQIIPSQAN